MLAMIITRWSIFLNINGTSKQASILSLMKRLQDQYELVYNNGGNCFFIQNYSNQKKLERFEIINSLNI